VLLVIHVRCADAVNDALVIVNYVLFCQTALQDVHLHRPFDELITQLIITFS